VATKALATLPVMTSSTASTAPPTQRSAASNEPGDIEVSESMRTIPSEGAASRIASKYSRGWARLTMSPSAIGACSRASIWNGSAASASSTARMRSGRSGWPCGTSWSIQAGWEMRRVDITYT